MTGNHDQASRSIAHSSGNGIGVPLEAGARKAHPLSDVLGAVRLTGALFFMVDATSPWCVDIPHTDHYAELILPHSQHVISYHIVLEGKGVASVPGSDGVPFEAGDIILFPHGDAYKMESAAGVPPEFDFDEALYFFREMAAGRLPFIVKEGGGEQPPAKFFCGFLGCDTRPFNPLLVNLPPVLKIRRQADGRDRLDQLIEMTMAEMQASDAGSPAMRVRFSELLFVELLRRYLQQPESGRNGWLAGLGDPVTGRALALLHADPARDWTLEDLAKKAGSSRSVLAARFQKQIGHGPIHYLTGWRMQLASQMLMEADVTVAAIAFEVGYASEAAFSRAFKKVTGLSPSEWRDRSRGHEREADL